MMKNSKAKRNQFPFIKFYAWLSYGVKEVLEKKQMLFLKFLILQVKVNYKLDGTMVNGQLLWIC